MKFIAALAVAFGIGFGCRWFGVPTPAPPMLQGAALVVAMTLGYMGAGYVRDAQARQGAVEAAAAPGADAGERR